ncbi:MAG TPA: polymer-forming cytoskeletal protein [Candidatus Acidoferrales bacterium]|jgi:cytoskeletal protein CcmA (bactofilin family)|nr:polymer-forming cytoskeletal protein [Candidatus Acidoferrales bacterium]
MWKPRPEDNSPTSTNQPSPSAPANVAPTMMAPPKEQPKPSAASNDRTDVGHIGKSVVIRGELTGNEDLYLDGEIEGNINLRDHKLVIGPNGKIKASITARDIVLHGRVEGNVSATERVELKKACTLVGDVSTQRIVIEDGAYFKGSIDIKDKENRSEGRKPVAVAAAAGAGMGVSSSTTYNASSGSQGSFLEPK